MTAESAIVALENRYLRDYPREAARKIEGLSVDEAAQAIEARPVELVVPVWEQLTTDVQERLMARLSEATVGRLLSEMDPPLAAELLLAADPADRARWTSRMEPGAARLVGALMAYEPEAAGRLMDPRVASFRVSMTVGEALERMRGFKKSRALRDLFVVDDEGKLSGRVEIQEVAMSSPDERLQRLARPVAAAVLDVAPRQEVVEKFEQYRVPVLPVVNVSGRLVGAIHQGELVAALQEETSVDIQTMVGVSKDERALSRVGFVVRKRLPWLQFNLITAALAASVVALFENTIAQFTALAVLMPVVAGESGNAGQQALAVTMRGLALREISARHLPRIIFKEVGGGLLNGTAVAATAALGVYLWTGSAGLMGVLAIAMVISMLIAVACGALIPITLSRLGFDPAQASSIFLTTVTDVAGFLSFLGIATALASWL